MEQQNSKTKFCDIVDSAKIDFIYNGKRWVKINDIRAVCNFNAVDDSGGTRLFKNDDLVYIQQHYPHIPKQHIKINLLRKLITYLLPVKENNCNLKALN